MQRLDLTQPKTSINYLAKFVEIDNLQPHPKADRLQITVIDGFNVIISLDAKLGDRGVFIPVECQLNDDFVRKNNLYEEATMNDDNTKRGFVNKHRRIRAINLRSEKSEGFFCPLSYLDAAGYSYKFTNNEEFNMFDDVLFVNKYIAQRNSQPQTNKSPGKKVARFDRLVEGQFKHHFDTSQLMKNLHAIDETKEIIITQKLHGTSAVFSNLLVRRKLS